MQNVNLETANAHQIYAALRQAFRPYETGSAYGTMRAELHGGSKTIVYGLAERSKQRATARDVVDALNVAHRDALCMSLRASTNAGALVVILSGVLDAAPAIIDTASVFLCDLWNINPNDIDADRGPYSIVYAASSVIQDAPTFIETLRTAARLGA
jgi:hypothetical protein